jgi:hypothetical protein
VQRSELKKCSQRKGVRVWTQHSRTGFSRHWFFRSRLFLVNSAGARAEVVFFSILGEEPEIELALF